jgi:hypothetical protein
MVIVRKTKNNKCWRGYREKGTFRHGWWECKLVWALWKSVWGLLKQSRDKIQPPCVLATPLLGINPKEMKSVYNRDTCAPMFVAALLTIVKLWVNLCVQMDKENVAHIHNRALLNHKEKQNRHSQESG